MVTALSGAGVSAAAPVGARIVTPRDWVELELDPGRRGGSIRRAVRGAIAANPRLAGDAVRLIGLLDDVSQQAQRSGGFYCASLALHDAHTQGLLIANVLLQIAADAEAPAAREIPMEVCAGLAAAVSCDPEWAAADITVVPLPLAGPAVRIEIVSDGVCLQYLVPVPRTSNQLIMTFSSPCPPYVGALIELFDAIATSLSFDYDNVLSASSNLSVRSGDLHSAWSEMR